MLLGLERILLKGMTRDRDSIAAAALFFGLGSLTLVPLAWGREIPTDAAAWAYPLAAVAVYAVAFGLYVSALRVGDATIVAPLYHGNGFFLLLLAVVFLGEPLTAWRVLGLALIVLGGALLESDGGLPSPKRLWARPDARMMIGAAALLAVGRTIDKAALATWDPRVYAVVDNAGIAVCLTAYLALRGRLGALALVRERPAWTLAAGAVNGVSYLFLLLALASFDVSVAEPASGLSLVITAVLARAFFGEPLGWRLGGGLVLVAGTVFLFL